jgi:hypothetical protein
VVVVQFAGAQYGGMNNSRSTRRLSSSLKNVVLKIVTNIAVQVLARVLGRGLTIGPVPHSSPVHYPFLAYHQYHNSRGKKPKKKDTPQSTKKC